MLTSVTPDPPPLFPPYHLFSVVLTVLDLFNTPVISCQFSLISKEDLPPHAVIDMNGH